MNPNFRNFALWVIIVLLVVALVMLFQKPSERAPTQDINFSQLLNEADQGHIRDVTISGTEITGHYYRPIAPSRPMRRTIRTWSKPLQEERRRSPRSRRPTATTGS